MLSCINEQCKCRAGYFKTSNGLCGLAYDQECSKENSCSDEFLCTQYDIGASGDTATKCLCPNTELQFYDGNTCIGVIGGPCKTNTNRCPKNARCINLYDLYDNDEVCQCQQGFVEINEMKCDVAYGLVCEPRNGWSLTF